MLLISTHDDGPDDRGSTSNSVFHSLPSHVSARPHAASAMSL